MLALANLALRGPLQAGALAALFGALPFLFWLGAAIAALVTLRLGPRSGLMITLWALLPTGVWLIYGQDPAPISVLLTAVIMAVVLQQRISWEKALLAGAAVTAVLGHALPALFPATMDQLIEMGVSVYEQMNPEMAEELDGDLETLVATMMIGTMAALNFFMATLSLLLARGWQARLFNPGGLRQEFREFRLSGPATLVCVMVMAFGPYVGMNPALAALGFGLPLVLAAIALIHAVVAKRNMGVTPLVLFYVTMVFFLAVVLLLLVFIAIIDSWLDLRNRLPEA